MQTDLCSISGSGWFRTCRAPSSASHITACPQTICRRPKECFRFAANQRAFKMLVRSQSRICYIFTIASLIRLSHDSSTIFNHSPSTKPAAPSTRQIFKPLLFTTAHELLYLHLSTRSHHALRIFIPHIRAASIVY